MQDTGCSETLPWPLVHWSSPGAPDSGDSRVPSATLPPSSFQICVHDKGRSGSEPQAPGLEGRGG